MGPEFEGVDAFLALKANPNVTVLPFGSSLV